MKTRAFLLVTTLSFFTSAMNLHAQGTAFTYQGQLMDAGAPAYGLYDLQFGIYNTSVGGSEIGPMLTNTATAVSNGLFTVTLDFGAGIFTGSNGWLEIAARTNGSGTFTELSPRQPLTPAPYAIFAEGANAAGLSGAIPMTSLSGTYGAALNFNNAANTFAGDGTGLINVNALTLDGLSSAAFWNTKGNAGANPSTGSFLGTTDNNPLELHVNGQRALRLAPTANDTAHSNIVNVLGGSAFNFVGDGVYGATICGGGALYYEDIANSNSVTADFGTVCGGLGNTVNGIEGSFIGGGFYNTASDANATIAGGYHNIANSYASTVAGGAGNTASGDSATIAGGYQNIATDDASTVAGGSENIASNGESTVSGGELNVASGYYATVPGGYENTANGVASFAAGSRAQALNDNCFVWSDGEGAVYYLSDRDNQFKIQAGGGMVLDVSGSSGHNPAAFEINSTSSDGEALFATQDSSSPTAEFANSGTGDLIKGFSGPSANTVVFEVVNDGTVYVKGVALTSDRNAKTNFASFDARTLLAQVAALPISEWNYKDDSSATRHIGPMAQDFHAAFGLNGADDKHISTVDEGGVALAAIQALNQKLEQESKAKDAQIQQLNQRLEKLEQLLTRDNVGVN